MTRYFYLFLLCFSFLQLDAQSAMRSFKGRLVDSATMKPLPDATVSIFKASDTSLVNFGFTTALGNFTLGVQIKDSLLIVISHLGHKEKTFKVVPAEDWQFINYGDVKLPELPFAFDAVKIRTAAITIKGDTIEINASKFKVLPGSDVAQLFKKIPGFDVNVKGEIKVNGSEVNKIMVDGSDFFGNNPGLVSKNLSADMIETVQVYDDRNIDGSPKEGGSKIINLKLKKGKKNGLFGDVMGGYGTQKRYESGLRLNNFKNDRKMSFVLNGNNTNETGFDFGFSNWHNARSYDKNGGANDDENWFVYSNDNQGEGNINNKLSSGLTYFNEFKGKKKLSFNVFGSRNNYSSISSGNNIFALNDSTQRINKDTINTTGLSKSLNTEINFTKVIDSTGNFDIGITGALYNNETKTNSLNIISVNGITINTGATNILQENSTGNIRANVSYRRVLRKDKRYSFIAYSQYKIYNSDGNNYQFQQNFTDTFNNRNNISNYSQQSLFKLFGAMPLYKKMLALNISMDRWQENNNSSQLSSRASNQYQNIFEQNYNNKVDSLSLEFDNRLVQYTVKPYISLERKYLYATAGATFMQFNLHNNNLTQNIILDRPYSKFLPYASISYYPQGKGYLYANVSKSTSFPTLNELQPVLNIYNNYNRLKGNTQLNPQDNVSFRLYGNVYKFKKFKYIYSSFDGSMSNNAKIWARQQTENGIIISTPVNAKGLRNFSGWISASRKIWKIMNIDLSVSGSSNKTPLIINSVESYSTSNSISVRPGLNFTKSDSLEFYVNMSWNSTDFKNALNNNVNYKQNIFNYSASVRTVLKFGTEVNSSIDISDQRNVPGIGKVVPVWSAYIQQPLSKKSNYSLKLTAYDILKQNTDISRYASENFVVINKSNRLQQYFMLTLIYKIKKMGEQNPMEYAY